MNWIKGETDCEELINNVPALVRRIKERLELKGFSDADLDTVEQFVRRKLKPEHLPEVYAFVGEAFRSRFGGQWKRSSVKDEVGFDEPVIDGAFGGGNRELPRLIPRQQIERLPQNAAGCWSSTFAYLAQPSPFAP